MSELLRDKYNRVIRDVRVSITDRCNFRCTYCMPAGFVPRPHKDILTYEEIERLVRLLASMGVEKVRLTGGEPLLRRDVTRLIGMVRGVPGIKDVALTTNGWFLSDFVPSLRDAGLGRLNLSMDSLDRDRFKRMTGVDALPRVLEGIEAATAGGFAPLKLNCVVIRGENDDEVVEFASFSRRTGHTVRFIEFMPLDSGRAWDRSLLVGGKEILSRIEAQYPLVALEQRSPSETALRYGFADAPGEIGLVAPVTMPFCGQCNRIRITADGKVRNCLFSLVEHDVRSSLRSGASDQEMQGLFRAIVAEKEPGHRINEPDFVQPERTMSCIGG